MDTITELDDLKSAWQALDRTLERRNAIDLQLLRERKTDKVRGSLRPLFWGQLAQLLLFGLPFVLLAAALWTRVGAGLQLSLPLLVAGIFVHAYGVATIAMAGCTLGLIKAIDYSAPVLSIQKQLARLRRFYIINGMVAGLPWWLMWVPVLMVLSSLADVDLYTGAPAMVWGGLGVGIAGLLATWAFHLWAHHPDRAEAGKRLDEGATGGSLRKARRILNELERFEQE